MNNDKKLEALLSLYSNVLNDIIFYQNQGDNTNIINLITIVVVPILQALNGSEIIIIMLCLSILIFQILSLQRGLQAHMFVAILRGYAAHIEDEINTILGENHFAYNSVYIDKYIASQIVVKTKGKSNTTKWSVFTTVLVHILIAMISVSFIIYNLAKIELIAWWSVTLSVIWYILTFILIIKLCNDFVKKEQKRYEARSILKTKANNTKAV